MEVSPGITMLQEYIEIFEPLMLEEAFALLQRGFVEAAEVPQPFRCVTGSAIKVGS